MKKRNLLFLIILITISCFMIAGAFVFYYLNSPFYEKLNEGTVAEKFFFSAMLIESIGYYLFSFMIFFLFFYACNCHASSKTYLDKTTPKFNLLFKRTLISMMVYYTIVSIIYIFAFAYSVHDYNNQYVENQSFYEYNDRFVIGFVSTIFTIEIIIWTFINFFVAPKYWYLNRFIYLIINFILSFIASGAFFKSYADAYDKWYWYDRYETGSTFLSYQPFGSINLVKAIAYILAFCSLIVSFYILNRKIINQQFKEFWTHMKVRELMTTDETKADHSSLF